MLASKAGSGHMAVRAGYELVPGGARSRAPGAHQVWPVHVRPTWSNDDGLPGPQPSTRDASPWISRARSVPGGQRVFALDPGHGAPSATTPEGLPRPAPPCRLDPGRGAGCASRCAECPRQRAGTEMRWAPIHPCSPPAMAPAAARGTPARARPRAGRRAPGAYAPTSARGPARASARSGAHGPWHHAGCCASVLPPQLSDGCRRIDLGEARRRQPRALGLSEGLGSEARR